MQNLKTIEKTEFLQQLKGTIKINNSLCILTDGLGLDFNSAMGSVIASLGNIGPGIGSVGPMDNFAHIPDVGKWFLSFLMMLGRLELFTVIIIFSPVFWKK